MVNTKMQIKAEAVFSENGEHRYFLSKQWNKEKPMACVILKSASKAGCVEEDLTTSLVINNCFRAGFGGVDLVNVFSSVSGDEIIERGKAASAPRCFLSRFRKSGHQTGITPYILPVYSVDAQKAQRRAGIKIRAALGITKQRNEKSGITLKIEKTRRNLVFLRVCGGNGRILPAG